MSSASPADRLVTACFKGDLPAAKAAIADGASVNDKGTAPGYIPLLPLAIALYRHRHDAVTWLLSRGADPNGDAVMCYAAYGRPSHVLQLLIDAGGDVNRESRAAPPLFWATHSPGDDEVRLLLAQPCLDVAMTSYRRTAQQYACERGKPAFAATIAQEVSGVWRTCSAHRMQPGGRWV